MAKKKLLDGHKQVGKKFIPEPMTWSVLKEINWCNDLVPELIWLAVLHEKLGYYKGNLVACEFHRVYVSICKTKFFQSMLSSYESMDNDLQTEILTQFKTSEYYDSFLYGLIDFHVFFPNHPLDFMFSGVSDKKVNLEVVKRAIQRLLDRRSKEAMIVQASLVLNSMVTGKFHAPKGSIFHEITEIENYPDTEKSVRLASSIRASINTFINPEMINTESNWVKEFWQRCIKIEPSSIKLELL